MGKASFLKRMKPVMEDKEKKLLLLLWPKDYVDSDCPGHDLMMQRFSSVLIETIEASLSPKAKNIPQHPLNSIGPL